jgi:hypothetical protein
LGAATAWLIGITNSAATVTSGIIFRFIVIPLRSSRGEVPMTFIRRSLTTVSRVEMYEVVSAPCADRRRDQPTRRHFQALASRPSLNLDFTLLRALGPDTDKTIGTA